MANETNPGLRHDFVLLFDVTDGNPNGDPDAGNMPRLDPETNQGLVTDVSLKRKVRDYVQVSTGGEAPFAIYVQKDGSALNTKHGEAYKATGLTSKGAKQPADDINRAREWMCKRYYDVRAFGAVMTTGVNCGQVLGPIQMTFARSLDPIVALDLSITRVAVTREEDRVQATDEEEQRQGKTTEMGRKPVVPYGLYLSHGFVTPSHAAKTGFSEADLTLFWEALVNMFELDHSASRGMMACRGLFVFTHENPLGNAPAHRLFDLVSVKKVSEPPARKFADYAVAVWDDGLPAGVALTRLEG